MPQRARPRADEDVGRLTLHRFCGVEEYALSAAEMLAFAHGSGIRLWFDAETNGQCLRALPDTGPHRPRPKVSVRVDLPALVPDELVGRRFAPADRDPNGDPPATLLYFESDELRSCELAVLGRRGSVFEVQVTGRVRDVNYYDGSKPETRVVVAGRFTFADVEQWEPVG